MRWILACALLSAGTVQAANPVESAKELAGEGKLVEAATVLGKAIAKAQRGGDVPAVIDLCDKLVEIVGRKVGPCDDPDKGDAYREVCYALMNTLDAKRRDAVISAQMLATEIVLQAAHAGDDRYLEDAVKILARHGKDKKAGLCAATMASFARALLDARKGEEGARRTMSAAYRTMVENGWLDLAVYAGVEMAFGDVKDIGGIELLLDLQKRLSKSKDVHLLRTARDVLAHRARRLSLPGARDLFKNMSDEEGAGTANAAGGAGGTGGSTVSSIGEKWKHLSRTKAFLSVTRYEPRFAVEYRFDYTEQSQVVQPGVKHQAHGGVTLSFWGPAVRLAMIDLTGRRGQPGEASGPETFEFFYRLAPGETWHVTRRGVVEIKPKR